MRLTIMFAVLIIGLIFVWAVCQAPVEAQGGLIALTDGGDQSGGNAVIAASASGTAVYIDAFNTSSSATIRCGAASGVSATVGKPIAAGGAYHWQAIPVVPGDSPSQHYYSLSTVGCYVPSGGGVNFSWAR